MSPWSIYDISEKAMAAFQNWREKQEEKRQLRFLEQEEKAAQAAMQAIEVEQEEAEVDPETGEILDDEDLSNTAVDFVEADYEKWESMILMSLWTLVAKKRRRRQM